MIILRSAHHLQFWKRKDKGEEKQRLGEFSVVKSFMSWDHQPEHSGAFRPSFIRLIFIICCVSIIMISQSRAVSVKVSQHVSLPAGHDGIGAERVECGPVAGRGGGEGGHPRQQAAHHERPARVRGVRHLRGEDQRRAGRQVEVCQYSGRRGAVQSRSSHLSQVSNHWTLLAMREIFAELVGKCGGGW